jgi:hypothetical protein
MVVMLEMAEFMHDDVFNAMDRGLHQIQVESDSA